VKVLLINPPAEQTLVGNNPKFLDEERGANPPLGLLYLAAALEQRTEHEVSVVDALAEEMSGQLQVVKYNTQQSKLVAQKMGIRSIPTLVLFKDGEVADVHTGAMSGDRMRSWVDRTVGPKTSLWSRLFGGDQASTSA